MQHFEILWVFIFMKNIFKDEKNKNFINVKFNLVNQFLIFVANQLSI